jgi:RNA recognition motif. (a.k.a. RRM, RBD, or RNP domain)
MAPAPLRAGAGGPSSHSGDAASLKVFVGGLDQSVNDIDFRTHFEQFGRITDAVIMFDRITKRSRGFGFVTYEDVGAMQVHLYVFAQTSALVLLSSCNLLLHCACRFL